MREHILFTVDAMHVIYLLDGPAREDGNVLMLLSGGLKRLINNAGEWGTRIIKKDFDMHLKWITVVELDMTLPTNAEPTPATSLSIRGKAAPIFLEHTPQVADRAWAVKLGETKRQQAIGNDLLATKDRVVRFWSSLYERVDQEKIDELWTAHIKCTGKYLSHAARGQWLQFDKEVANCLDLGTELGTYLDLHSC